MDRHPNWDAADWRMPADKYDFMRNKSYVNLKSEFFHEQKLGKPSSIFSGMDFLLSGITLKVWASGLHTSRDKPPKQSLFQVLHSQRLYHQGLLIVSGLGNCALEHSCIESKGSFHHVAMSSFPRLKTQEIPLEHPDSNFMFRPGREKAFVATPAAIEAYTHEVIVACWLLLRQKADEHNGIDYLQVFEDESKPENLWFIEDGPGGAITALLPSDY
jgi:hypothetical protein